MSGFDCIYGTLSVASDKWHSECTVIYMFMHLRGCQAYAYKLCAYLCTKYLQMYAHEWEIKAFLLRIVDVKNEIFISRRASYKIGDLK